LLLSHGIYMYNNWSPGEIVLGIGWNLVGQSEQGSGCICPACVEWGPSVVVDTSQVTNLLSWAYTCLWEREDLLLSCHRFRLFSEPTVKGGLLGGGLSTAPRSGLRYWGLEFQFGRGHGPLNRSGTGWSYLCPGYRWGVCFGVPSWATLIRESPFLRDGTTWLWSSTTVRTEI
jgi:hypothetical protein